MDAGVTGLGVVFAVALLAGGCDWLARRYDRRWTAEWTLLARVYG